MGQLIALHTHKEQKEKESTKEIKKTVYYSTAGHNHETRRLRVAGKNMDVNNDVGDQASVVTRRISNVHQGNVVASEYHLQVRASILLSNVWYCVTAFVSAAEAFVV